MTPRAGYAELGAGYTAVRGGFGWAEAGWRPTKDTALFARAEADRTDAGVMAGFRWDW